LASAACYLIQLALGFRPCRPLNPNDAVHRFRCGLKSGRHSVGTGGRHGPEQVVGMNRNRWSPWPGLCIDYREEFCHDHLHKGKLYMIAGMCSGGPLFAHQSSARWSPLRISKTAADGVGRAEAEEVEFLKR